MNHKGNNISFSLNFPFNEASIISSYRIKITIIRVEHDSNDMRRMSSEAFWNASFAVWISIKINPTPIISSSKDFARCTSVNTINVRSVSIWREDSLNGPS